MDMWVIDYALHVNSMKEEECSQRDIAEFRDALDACLAARGFERLEGFHASAKREAISDAYLACTDISAIDGSDRFISKLNLFRVNDLNDLLPVMFAGRALSNESPDSMEGITMASTVAAVVQDLFLDGTGQSDHKPNYAPKKRTASTKAS